MCLQEINNGKVIKIPMLIFTLSKDSRACCGKADTEKAKEMLWNGSLKENWAFSLLSTRCIPNIQRPVAQEISLDNKHQMILTCMILKSHNIYKEIESITEIKC